MEKDMIIEVGLSVNELDKKSNVSPLRALKEIIWNSCDADANNIQIDFERSGLIDDQPYITKIIAHDDGHGLSYEKAAKVFEIFGESEKAYKFESPKGRKFHGKLGEGRYTYFSLGGHIKWNSTYEESGKLNSININFDAANKKKVKISENSNIEQSSGMKIEIANILSKNQKFLVRKEEIIQSLISEFAGYLLAHQDINVKYDGTYLNVLENIEKSFNFTYSNNDINCNIKIIKWKDINVKQRYICGVDNVVYHEEKLKHISQNLSIYISSLYFDELNSKGLIDAENLNEDYSNILKFADECLSNVINEDSKNEDQLLLKEIQEDDSYPFKEQSNDLIEIEQQKLFDIVAVEIAKNSPQTRNAGKQSKNLTNRLILEAIKTNPSSIKRILKEVFDLSKEKQDELAKILDHVSLNNIISTMQEVTNRLTFLEELYQIVYTEKGRHMRERTEFQKILLEELWIFGDKYKYGTDDQSLRNVLKKHLKELTKDDLELTEDQRNNPKLDNIPDICLWNNQKIGDSFENLVVEIKRPTKILGEKEWSQIERYAFAVADEPGFSNTQWQFILVGKDFDGYVKTKLKSFGSDHQVINQDNVKVKILKWADIIAENKLRYEYFKEKSKFVIQETEITEAIDKRWDELKTEVNLKS